MRKSENSSILLKNIGLGSDFFERVSTGYSVYLIRREKIRKVFSENAVIKLENIDESIRNNREAEDRYIYDEMESNIFPGKESMGHEAKRNIIIDSTFIPRNSNFCEEKGPSTKIEFGLNQNKNINFNNLSNNLSVFRNCSETQMNQLKHMFSEMNSSEEEKVLIKAYKSKMKTKFYQIYEKNSQINKEKTKDKMFHKCNYPSCGRTFASSGWLRSHFKDHLTELKRNKFNVQFQMCWVKLNTLHCKKIKISK